MANWGRRVNCLTWIALVCALVFWVIGLSGLAALSRIYQDPNNYQQLQWWIIWFQIGALFAASLVHYKEWFGARGVIMGLMCVLTAMLMTQTNVANYQRQAVGAGSPYSDANPLLQQTHDIAAAMASQVIANRGSGQQQHPQQQQQQQIPQLPPELLQGLTGIISGLDTSTAMKAAANALQNATLGAGGVPPPSSNAAVPSSGVMVPAGASSAPPGAADGGMAQMDPREAAVATAAGGARAGGGPGPAVTDPRQQQQPGGPGGGYQPSGGGGGGGGGGRRRLLAAGADAAQHRANVVFLGFMLLTLADLALLVLFGVQHPHSKERSPRLYISSAMDQQQPPQYKDGAMEGVTLQVTAMPMRQGLRPESRAASGVSLRFDGARPASASVVPMRQPSRKLSGSFPFKLAERMDSRQAARESPMREARVTRLGSRQMSDAGLLGIRLEEGTPCQLPMAPIPCRQSLERC